MRDTFLPFARPSITDAEIEAVVVTLRSGWLTTGPQTKRFEREFAAYVGTPHAVALNSCTAALHLALDAIGVGQGDEVIVPVTTFTATAEVVRYRDATPVFVDIDPDTFNIDPAAVEQAVTGRTRAIIPVHIGGQPAEMDPLLDIARAHDLTVIEDAAHALPARYKGRMAGTLGDLAAFSFYATKTITTGEGGMLTTANAEYAARATLMSLHGISKDAWRRYSAEGSWYYEVEDAGYKYNMTDLAASLGLAQLGRCDDLWMRRQTIAAAYNNAFEDLDGVEIPYVAPHVEHSWHLYILKLDSTALDINRAEVIRELHERGIGTSVHYIPLHLQPYWRRLGGHAPDDFPVALSTYEKVFSLPIYPAMTPEDVADVCTAVTAVVRAHYRRSPSGAGSMTRPEPASV